MRLKKLTDVETSFNSIPMHGTKSVVGGRSLIMSYDGNFSEHGISDFAINGGKILMSR